jgi:hypothetical protein
MCTRRWSHIMGTVEVCTVYIRTVHEYRIMVLDQDVTPCVLNVQIIKIMERFTKNLGELAIFL